MIQGYGVCPGCQEHKPLVAHGAACADCVHHPAVSECGFCDDGVFVLRRAGEPAEEIVCPYCHLALMSTAASSAD